MEYEEINLNIMNLAEDLHNKKSRALRFGGGSKEDFLRWQDIARKKLRELLCIDNYKESPLKLSRKNFLDTEGYIVEKITYGTVEGLKASAYLLIPKGKKLPLPAVLCPPGHGGGMNQLLLEEPCAIEGCKGIYKQFPLGLVRKGLIALIPENIGFGERGGIKISDKEYQFGKSHQFLFKALNLLGYSQIGLMVRELQRALDLMQSIPDIDGSSIGCCGLSLGGELTMLLSAIDNRISCACISGYFSSYRKTYLEENHCGCGCSYDLARYFEHIDITALIAPRPLLIESGKSDEIFPVEEAAQNFRELTKLYESMNAEKNLFHDIFEGAHEISGRIAFDWFEDKLIKMTDNKKQ